MEFGIVAGANGDEANVPFKLKNREVSNASIQLLG